jgi:hypothetical protein
MSRERKKTNHTYFQHQKQGIIASERLRYRAPGEINRKGKDQGRQEYQINGYSIQGQREVDVQPAIGQPTVREIKGKFLVGGFTSYGPGILEIQNHTDHKGDNRSPKCDLLGRSFIAYPGEDRDQQGPHKWCK